MERDNELHSVKIGGNVYHIDEVRTWGNGNTLILATHDQQQERFYMDIKVHEWQRSAPYDKAQQFAKAVNEQSFNRRIERQQQQERLF